MKLHLAKKIKQSFLGIGFLLLSTLIFAQNGKIRGSVINAGTNEAIPFANIVLEGTQKGASSDIDGNFVIEEITPGIYNLKCVSIGYKPVLISEIRVGNIRNVDLKISMEETAIQMEEVEIKSNPFVEKKESPTSLRSINATEIYRSPGGNRDISRVIQNLPGVASGLSFRNDVIVRGGAPNENRFFLDGVEVPNINHFATQGSSGGPVGLINVNFIREVDFYSSAFPANKGNALSSVIDIKQISGNKEGLNGTFMLGSSDVGLTLDGPTGKNSSLILSVRRSYLQLLFRALSLPFLPTYNDFQLKEEIQINKNNSLSIIALGAIDQFALNTSVNDRVSDSLTLERNNYILGNLPVNEQWNYTVGAVWKRFNKVGYQQFVLSRNHLDNRAFKYRNNIAEPQNLLLDYNSAEIENKFRFEQNLQAAGWQIKVGLGLQHVIYTNETFQQILINNQLQLLDFNSTLRFNRYALFGQASKSFFSDRLDLSLGLRNDISDYSKQTSNPIDQLSPRLGLSYDLTEFLQANFSTGRYTQLPPYTVMGFRNNAGDLVNKNNGLKYIISDHVAGGLSYQLKEYTKISGELFFKNYSNYPFLLAKGISLANVPADFGVIGNEEVNSTSSGRSYGLEILLQQKQIKNWYGILSYTWVRSEFTNAAGQYLPSAWDNRHIVNATGGRKFKNNWELGFRFRLLGGAPFTPYNEALSLQKEVWDANQQGILDYSLLNNERNKLAYGVDVRLDKSFYFKKALLNVYLDIQNITNAQIQTQDFIDVVRDAEGNPVEDPNKPNSYLGKRIENVSGNLLPSIGVMVEF